jgi:hypothetical protein
VRPIIIFFFFCFNLLSNVFLLPVLELIGEFYRKTQHFGTLSVEIEFYFQRFVPMKVKYLKQIITIQDRRKKSTRASKPIDHLIRRHTNKTKHNNMQIEIQFTIASIENNSSKIIIFSIEIQNITSFNPLIIWRDLQK